MLEEKKFYPLRYDAVFASIFNNPDNLELTKELIALLFNIDKSKLKNLKVMMRDEKLIINEVGESKKLKIKRPCQRDVVVDVDGEKYNVEIDCHYDEGVMKKNTHYLGRLYAEQEKQKNNKYESILPVNQMNIIVKGLNQGKVIDSYPRQNNKKRVIGKNTMRTYLLDVDFGNQKWYTGCRDKMINFCHLLMAENTSQIKEAIEEHLVKVNR